MKLDKAIEILTIHSDHNPNSTAAERREAHQLGLEALKRLAFNRLNTIASSDELLPGETTTDAPNRSLHHIKAVLESPRGEK